MNDIDYDHDQNDDTNKQVNQEALFEEFSSKGANNNVAIIPQDLAMRTVVEFMVAKGLSSVLMHDSKQYISGIITEHDIVHKFLLLDFDDKYERSAITIATRPVIYINHLSYQEDLIKLYLEKNIHHFPIVNASKPKTDNVIGMTTIASYLRQFLAKEHPKNEKVSRQKNLIKIYYLNGSREPNNKSIRCLENLGVKVYRITDFNQFYNKYEKTTPPLMFDMDSFPVKESQNLMKMVKNYLGPTFFLTNNANLIQAFRLFLNPDRQVISLKPIDYIYFYWLLKHKWSTKKS